MNQELRGLIVECFTIEELRIFVADFYPAVRDSVSFDGPVEQAAFEFIEAVSRRNLVDDELFDKLVDTRPKKLDTINLIRAKRSSPAPAYSSDDARQLGEELQRLYKERAFAEGEHIVRLTEEIKQVKRRLREGLQLPPGYVLLDRYQLLSKLGQGGFAVVWKAYDLRMHRAVALKMLHSHVTDEDRVERFFRGARLMQELEHPGIVRVWEPRCEDQMGSRFFVMELLRGGNFQEAIKKKRLSPDTILGLIEKVARAISVAHNRIPAAVHRDVKPSNILLSRDGNPKLTDFDLVRSDDTSGGTPTGGPLGTIAFAAPEAIQDGSRAGPPADVYGLAMTTVVALSRGRTPDYVQKNRPDLLIQGLPVSRPVAEVLLRSIAIDANIRPKDGGDFLDRLVSARSPTMEILQASEPLEDSNDAVDSQFSASGTMPSPEQVSDISQTLKVSFSEDASRVDDSMLSDLTQTQDLDPPSFPADDDLFSPYDDNARLICINGRLAGTEFRLLDDEVSLGRSFHNGVMLDSSSVSNYHALVRRVGDAFFVLDRDSRNGTTLNRVRIKVETVIRNGDLLQIGGVKLRFVAAGAAFVPTPAEIESMMIARESWG